VEDLPDDLEHLLADGETVDLGAALPSVEVISDDSAEDIQDLVEVAVDALEVKGRSEAPSRVLVLLDKIVEEEEGVPQGWMLL
jgi:hypothetical protein